MPNENLIIQLSLLEQQSQEIEKQIQLIDHQINELQNLSISLDKFNGEGEILAPFGKGIFVKSEVKDKKLFMNIGSGIVVKKTPKEAVEIVENQVDKLSAAKSELLEDMGKINAELIKLIDLAEKSQESKD
ncbi:MAG: prefoldin subunit alpha [archaeon]